MKYETKLRLSDRSTATQRMLTIIYKATSDSEQTSIGSAVRGLRVLPICCWLEYHLDRANTLVSFPLLGTIH